VAARARARAERAARRESAARKARADRAASRKRAAARRDAAAADRSAVEGDPAPPVDDPEPQVKLEPAASRGSSGGVALGTDLTMPLLLLSAVSTLALATRYTVRSLRQE
jgi:hypothetical protein